MSKLTKFENSVLNDTMVITLVATPVAFWAAGGSVIAGLVIAVPLMFPAVFLTCLSTEFIAKPPGALNMVFVWAIAAAVAYASASGLGTSQPFAQLFALAIFATGWGRSLWTLQRLQLAGIDPMTPNHLPDKPADADAAAPLPAADATPTALPPPAEAPIPALSARPAAAPPPAFAPSLPVLEDLPAEIEAITAAAQRDFHHLCDALADPSLAGAAGVDVAGMRREADALLRDIMRRAPLVARVRRIAAERTDDEPARKTSDDALAALRRQADALRGATSAALQVAATAGHDPTLLREHTDNLHLLREIREDARNVH